MRFSTCSILLFLVGQSLGQQASSIDGKVLGPAGEPVAFAQVLVQPGTARTATRQDGTFDIEGLQPGQYTVIVLAEHFSAWAGYRVRVRSDQCATLDIRLSPPPPRLTVKYLYPTAKDVRSFDAALSALEEPCFCSPTTIHKANSGEESYRFLWLRSFDRPVLISLVLKGGLEAQLTYKETDGKGGYKLGTLVETKTVDLAKKLGKGEYPDDIVKGALDAFRQEAESEIWEQPFGIDHGTIGLDGATWTIEATKNGECHLVTRWSPDNKDKVRWFADRLIELAPKRFYYDEVY